MMLGVTTAIFVVMAATGFCAVDSRHASGHAAHA